MQRLATAAWVVALAALLAAQDNSAARAARAWRQQHEGAIVSEFVDLLKVPNVGKDRENLKRNADHIQKMMEARGVQSRQVSSPDANPVVLGEIRTPGASRTIVFYAHYDGQPIDPQEWATPPFEPTLRDKPLEAGGRVLPLPSNGAHVDPEARLYGRSTGDDKAPIVALMTALDALKAAGLSLNSNIKFAFEGEEEFGSPNLTRMLADNRAAFAGDVWIMCDGPVHQTSRQLVAFGARDVVTFDLTVYGPRAELHSGHYGNWAPNPAMELATLLASMKDSRGRVVVDKFYAGITPLSATEQRALADAPDIDAELMREFELGSTEASPKKLVELITQPSFNIRGLSSGHVGSFATNVVPSSATAAIDIRLVKGMDPERTLQLVVDHIRKQGYFVVSDGPPSAEVRQAHARVAYLEKGHMGLGAVRTPMDWPLAQEIIRAVESVRGPSIKIPNMGGSLPLAEVERPLGTRTVVVPIANHDNHQHSFNENLRIQNLWDGIELFAALLTM